MKMSGKFRIIFYYARLQTSDTGISYLQKCYGTLPWKINYFWKEGKESDNWGELKENKEF